MSRKMIEATAFVICTATSVAAAAVQPQGGAAGSLPPAPVVTTGASTAPVALVEQKAGTVKNVNLDQQLVIIDSVQYSFDSSTAAFTLDGKSASPAAVFVNGNAVRFTLTAAGSGGGKIASVWAVPAAGSVR